LGKKKDILNLVINKILDINFNVVSNKLDGYIISNAIQLGIIKSAITKSLLAVCLTILL